jgi:hypothetical protein
MATLAVAFGGFGGPSMSEAGDVGGSQWYKVTLEEGETQGFKWTVGAKGRAHVPLKEICVLTAFIAPPEPGVPYGEGDEGSVCGSAKKPTDSTSSGATLGSTGTSLLAVIYRPVVRKVTFLLSTGKRKVFRTQEPRLLDREKRGIPAFRYLVASFDGGACVRGITTFDGKGQVISKEGEPCSGRAWP